MLGGIHLVDTPGDADHRARGALAGRQVGQLEVGVHHPLRPGCRVALQERREVRAHGGRNAGQLAVAGQHVTALGRLSRGQQAGAEGARLDQGDIDPEGRHLVAQPLCVALQRVLGGAVRGEEGRRDLAHQGRGVDDQARLGRPHRGQHRLHRPDGTEVVGLHLRPGLGDAEGLGDAQEHDPGVVDQHVHGPVRQDAGERGGDRGVVGHVHVDDRHRARVRLQRRRLGGVAPLCVNVG